MKLAVCLALALIGVPPLLAPGHATPAVAQAACDAPLVLTLLPGSRAPDGSLHSTPAPDIPPDPVLVAVPVYPGAVPSAARADQPVEIAADSPYMKTAAAVYALPADPETILTWYVEAFTACGYTYRGSSTEMQGSATVGWNQTYGSPTIPSLEIDLGFTRNSAGGTLIEYVAGVLSFPPRPYVSQIPGGIKRVEMTFDAGAYGVPRPGKALRLTITSRTMVFDLANAVNGLRDRALLHSCGPYRGVARMVFVAAHKRMTVTDACGDVTVDSFPRLADDYREVWTTARLVVAKYCAKHRCRSAGLDQARGSAITRARL